VSSATGGGGAIGAQAEANKTAANPAVCIERSIQKVMRFFMLIVSWRIGRITSHYSYV
jgi:hypothetical protein